jgi:Aspartyl protease/PDZ domain
VARGLVAVALAMGASGCLYMRGRGSDERVRRALASIDRPSEHPRSFRYEVTGDGGSWEHQVVVAPGRYAERRTRLDGATHAFGVDDEGAWLAVSDRPVVVVDGAWSWQARTSAALVGLRFAEPDPEQQGDHRELVGRYVTGWELAYRPQQGDTAMLQLDPRKALPFAVDRFDTWARITTCAQLEWRPSEDGVVLDSAECGTNNGGDRANNRTFRVRRALVDDELLDEVPSWALGKGRNPRVRSRLPQPLPITDPTRIELPTQVGDGPPRDLVLDTGAFHTVITEELARASGVVPTGEAPIWARGPWIGDSEDWVGVADRVVIGNMTFHGVRLLVSPRLGNVDGLIGRDLLRRVGLEVDSPTGRVLLWEREGYELPKSMKRLPLRRARARVQVDDVVTGPMLLDTGMPDNMVVHHYMMAIKHPRRHRSAAFLSAHDRLDSPDYHTEIDGIRLGPYRLPRMPAVGRDREREELGGGVGILGMGVMRYFRLAFDLRDGWLGVEPGDAYHVLHRLGVDVEDGPLGPTIDRVVRWSPAEQAGLRVGDVVLGVDGETLDDVRAIRRRIARSAGPFVRLVLSRRGLLRRRSVPLSSRR